jgi:hypothetical protein
VAEPVRCQAFDGLIDEPRPGQPRKITDEVVEQVIVATLAEAPPAGATQWSTWSMAAKVGLNQAAITGSGARSG